MPLSIKDILDPQWFNTNVDIETPNLELINTATRLLVNTDEWLRGYVDDIIALQIAINILKRSRRNYIRSRELATKSGQLDRASKLQISISIIDKAMDTIKTVQEKQLDVKQAQSILATDEPEGESSEISREAVSPAIPDEHWLDTHTIENIESDKIASLALTNIKALQEKYDAMESYFSTNGGSLDNATQQRYEESLSDISDLIADQQKRLDYYNTKTTFAAGDVDYIIKSRIIEKHALSSPSDVQLMGAAPKNWQEMSKQQWDALSIEERKDFVNGYDINRIPASLAIAALKDLREECVSMLEIDKSKSKKGDATVQTRIDYFNDIIQQIDDVIDGFREQNATEASWIEEYDMEQALNSDEITMKPLRAELEKISFNSNYVAEAYNIIRNLIAMRADMAIGEYKDLIEHHRDEYADKADELRAYFEKRESELSSAIERYTESPSLLSTAFEIFDSVKESLIDYHLTSAIADYFERLSDGTWVADNPSVFIVAMKKASIEANIARNDLIVKFHAKIMEILSTVRDDSEIKSAIKSLTDRMTATNNIQEKNNLKQQIIRLNELLYNTQQAALNMINDIGTLKGVSLRELKDKYVSSQETTQTAADMEKDLGSSVHTTAELNAKGIRLPEIIPSEPGTATSPGRHAIQPPYWTQKADPVRQIKSWEPVWPKTKREINVDYSALIGDIREADTTIDLNRESLMDMSSRVDPGAIKNESSLYFMDGETTQSPPPVNVIWIRLANGKQLTTRKQYLMKLLSQVESANITNAEALIKLVPSIYNQYLSNDKSEESIRSALQQLIISIKTGLDLIEKRENGTLTPLNYWQELGRDPRIVLFGSESLTTGMPASTVEYQYHAASDDMPYIVNRMIQLDGEIDDLKLKIEEANKVGKSETAREYAATIEKHLDTIELYRRQYKRSSIRTQVDPGELGITVIMRVYDVYEADGSPPSNVCECSHSQDEHENDKDKCTSEGCECQQFKLDIVDYKILYDGLLKASKKYTSPTIRSENQLYPGEYVLAVETSQIVNMLTTTATGEPWRINKNLRGVREALNALDDAGFIEIISETEQPKSYKWYGDRKDKLIQKYKDLQRKIQADLGRPEEQREIQPHQLISFTVGSLHDIGDEDVLSDTPTEPPKGVRSKKKIGIKIDKGPGSKNWTGATAGVGVQPTAPKPHTSRQAQRQVEREREAAQRATERAKIQPPTENPNV